MLQAQDARVDRVVFPVGVACSLTKHLSDGAITEVAIVGNEGVIGAAVFFGDNISSYGVVVEVPCAGAQAVSADDFIDAMSRRVAFTT